MEEKRKKLLISIKEYLIIGIGMLLYTLGWVFFLIPNELVGGGVTGMAAIIYYMTGFNVSYSFFLINGVLLIIALQILGRGFGAKTVYAIVMGTLFLKLLPEFIPYEIIEEIAIGNGKLLSAIMGGAFSGAGIAIAFTQGGSTGGTDIIALMINKYHNISPGKLVLMVDLVVVLSSLVIPTAEGIGYQVSIIIYGLILISVTGYTIDMVLSGARQSVQLFIFSQDHTTIADKITKTGRGVTVLNAMGWFTKKEGKVLMVIVRRTEISYIFKVIREVDKNAFISVGNVMGVYGQGFDVIKS